MAKPVSPLQRLGVKVTNTGERLEVRQHGKLIGILPADAELTREQLRAALALIVDRTPHDAASSDRVQ